MKDTEVRSSGLTLLPTTAMERPQLGAFNSLTMGATEAIFPFRIQNALHLVGRQITYQVTTNPPKKRITYIPPGLIIYHQWGPPGHPSSKLGSAKRRPRRTSNKHQVVDARWVMASQPTTPLTYHPDPRNKGWIAGLIKRNHDIFIKAHTF